MSYLSATKKDIEKLDNSDNQYKPGWTYYSKVTKKCVYRSTIKPVVECKLNSYDINEIYKKLSLHWNNYRDCINNLLGDISPYYDYKLQLKNIELEEKMIEDAICNRIIDDVSENNDNYQDNI